MKTKHLLTMAALTLGFAACNQEELVENVAVNPLDRAALDMTVEFPGASVESRMVYDEASFGWKWEAGDKFSAFMVDGAEQWKVADNLATNYIYSQGEDGSYSTTSQMVEGQYWFFAPAKENKLDRKLISYELSTNQPADYYKSEASQVYFSPIYKLEAANNAANVVLKPTVYNLYSQAIFHLKNEPTAAAHKDMNVLQIILKGNFATKGDISPVEIAKKSYFVYNNGSFVSAYTNYTEDVLKNADVVVNETPSTSIALNVNKTWKKGETLTATMLVPQAAAQDLEVIIVTDNGSIVITKTQAPELANVAFKHHGAKYIFGKLSDNSMKPFAANSGNLVTVAGKYISSAEDMVKAINASQTSLFVNRVGDWTIDENVINAANNNANLNITFNDEMTVENNSSVELEMNKFTFTNGWILAKGSIKTANAPKNVTGGVLNYNGVGTALVNNGGEIIVNTTTVASLTNNKGKVTINADVTLTSPLVNGVEKASVAELVVNANKTLTLQHSNTGRNDAYTLNDVLYESTITNNGTILVKNGEFINEGALYNNGTIKIDKINVHARIVNEGNVYNTGTIIGENNTTNTYSGFINNSYLEMTRFAATLTDVLGNGYVNNNANGFVTAADKSTNTIYFEASGDVTEVNSGCNLMVVNNNVIGKATVNADVLFIGTTAVRTSLDVTGNVYVFTEAKNDKLDTLVQMLNGTWADDTARNNYKANTSLTVQGEVKISETLYNYATIYNRKTVQVNKVEGNGAWQGAEEIDLVAQSAN